MSRHDVMVQSKALELIGLGYRNVRAHLPGWARPKAITSHDDLGTYIPDVTGDAPDGICDVFEVETEADALTSSHTYEQCKAFATFAKRNPRVRAWLSYPPELDAKAAELVQRVNSDLTSWTEYASVYAQAATGNDFAGIAVQYGASSYQQESDSPFADVANVYAAYESQIPSPLKGIAELYGSYYTS